MHVFHLRNRNRNPNPFRYNQFLLLIIFLIFYVIQEFFRPVLVSKNISLGCNWVTFLRSASLTVDIKTYSVTDKQGTVGVSMSTAKN